MFASRVDADRLRFRDRPETDVRFRGSAGRTSASRSERRNLPDRVTGAGEHRDVRVDYLLTSRLDPLAGA
ncbi:hypothetical protein N566_13305 [Streptomycetaceae bacterium MP113-05]|nr:hypothetical protein N566_13305 [Streptomycetaceae bacterium MP113-05]